MLMLGISGELSLIITSLFAIASKGTWLPLELRPERREMFASSVYQIHFNFKTNLLGTLAPSKEPRPIYLLISAFACDQCPWLAIELPVVFETSKYETQLPYALRSLAIFAPPPFKWQSFVKKLPTEHWRESLRVWGGRVWDETFAWRLLPQKVHTWLWEPFGVHKWGLWTDDHTTAPGWLSFWRDVFFLFFRSHRILKQAFRLWDFSEVW